MTSPIRCAGTSEHAGIGRFRLNAVMQQEEGQAFWINRGRAQQTQIVRVSITGRQTAEAWEIIRQQEEIQRAKLESAGKEKQEQEGLAKNRVTRHPAISPPQESTTSGVSRSTYPASSKPHEGKPPGTSVSHSSQSQKQRQTKPPSQTAQNGTSTRERLASIHISIITCISSNSLASVG